MHALIKQYGFGKGSEAMHIGETDPRFLDEELTREDFRRQVGGRAVSGLLEGEENYETRVLADPDDVRDPGAAATARSYDEFGDAGL